MENSHLPVDFVITINGASLLTQASVITDKVPVLTNLSHLCIYAGGNSYKSRFLPTIVRPLHCVPFHLLMTKDLSPIKQAPICQYPF
jgi:hypothetical protein